MPVGRVRLGQPVGGVADVDLARRNDAQHGLAVVGQSAAGPPRGRTAGVTGRGGAAGAHRSVHRQALGDREPGAAGGRGQGEAVAYGGGRAGRPDGCGVLLPVVLEEAEQEGAEGGGDGSAVGLDLLRASMVRASSARSMSSGGRPPNSGPKPKRTSSALAGRGGAGAGPGPAVNAGAALPVCGGGGASPAVGSSVPTLSYTTPGVPSGKRTWERPAAMPPEALRAMEPEGPPWV
ncbi:hypothetical protein SMICM17S_00292 [Streptomyces microflavus]